MVDFGGFSLPVQYAGDSKQSLSIVDSCFWTREKASLFDVSHMCSLVWSGKDAVKFLETMTVADLEGLGDGRGTLSVGFFLGGAARGTQMRWLCWGVGLVLGVVVQQGGGGAIEIVEENDSMPAVFNVDR